VLLRAQLRLAVPATQKLASDSALAAAVLMLRAAPPTRDIYDFNGDATLYDEAHEGGYVQEPLALENTLWANTVLGKSGSFTRAHVERQPAAAARRRSTRVLGCASCDCFVRRVAAWFCLCVEAALVERHAVEC
jgi:hypothetical protein